MRRCEKGKPAVRPGRKAMGLDCARSPGCRTGSTTISRRFAMRKNSRHWRRNVTTAPKFDLECLDGRALLSAALHHGIVTIGGTEAADTINVSVDPAGTNLLVDLNGQSFNFDLSLL